MNPEFRVYVVKETGFEEALKIQLKPGLISVGWIMNAAQYELKKEFDRDVVHLEVFDDSGSVLSKVTKVRISKDCIEYLPLLLIDGKLKAGSAWKQSKLDVYAW